MKGFDTLLSMHELLDAIIQLCASILPDSPGKDPPKNRWILAVCVLAGFIGIMAVILLIAQGFLR
jgi:hypothetical protein